jgi:hypothetical protein
MSGAPVLVKQLRGSHPPPLCGQITAARATLPQLCVAHSPSWRPRHLVWTSCCGKLERPGGSMRSLGRASCPQSALSTVRRGGRLFASSSAGSVCVVRALAHMCCSMMDRIRSSGWSTEAKGILGPGGDGLPVGGAMAGARGSRSPCCRVVRYMHLYLSSYGRVPSLKIWP